MAIADVRAQAVQACIRLALLVEDGIPSALEVDEGLADCLADKLRVAFATAGPGRLVVRVQAVGLDARSRMRIRLELTRPPVVLATEERSFELKRRSREESQPTLNPRDPLELWVVDDEPVARTIMDKMLRRFGSQPRCFSSGSEVLDYVDQDVDRPDLVFMDMSMPGLDGLSTVRLLLRKGVDAPIVGLSANRFADDRRACVMAGMVDYLSKPVRLGQLERILDCWTD